MAGSVVEIDSQVESDHDFTGYIELSTTVRDMSMVAATWHVEQNRYTNKLVDQIDDFRFKLAAIQSQLDTIDGPTLEADLRSRYEVCVELYEDLATFVNQYKAETATKTESEPAAKRMRGLEREPSDTCG